MANPQQIVKAWCSDLPDWVQRSLPYVPFSVRFGSPYTTMVALIEEFSKMSARDQECWVLSKLQECVSNAYRNIPFYRQLYDEEGVRPDELISLADFEKFPIVTKEMLREVPVSARTIPSRLSIKTNTGGTTGQPLEFFIDKNAFAREWAHMHKIWGGLGYSPTDLKLTVRGKDHGEQAIVYNGIHNELSVNAYIGHDRVADELSKLSLLKKIRYVHGYPSGISELFSYLNDTAPDVIATIKEGLRGVFYGSEYPAPIYREKVREILQVPDISWYGHSEMAILAYEKHEPFEYDVMRTYGYCEAVSQSDHPSSKLIGTSFWNSTAPLIRYDTGDLIRVRDSERTLISFRVAEGRVGDFIVDKNHQKISLTGLVFGRHHKVFSWASSVQISQSRHGEVTIYVNPMRTGSPKSAQSIADDFDADNVKLDITFAIVSSPIKTEAGKTPLLVSEEDAQRLVIDHFRRAHDARHFN